MTCPCAQSCREATIICPTSIDRASVCAMLDQIRKYLSSVWPLNCRPDDRYQLPQAAIVGPWGSKIMISNDKSAILSDALLEEVSARHIARARRSTVKFRRRLKAAISSGVQHRYRGLMIRMMRSFDCRLAALVVANRRAKPANRETDAFLIASAQDLNLWECDREPVRAVAKIKSTGGHRLLMAFGLNNRAKQILVKWVLEPWIRPRLLPCQHVLSGGRDAAVTACKRTIEKGGHRWVTEIDIKNCFGSISVDWLKDKLPIPKRVIEAVIASSNLNIRAISSIACSLLSKSRNGIPQGSAVSPLIAEFVVSCVLREAPAGACSESYVDNVFCFAVDVSGIRQHRESFELLFERHPAGSFSVRSTEPKRISLGFMALGYWITRGRATVNVAVLDSKISTMVDEVQRNLISHRTEETLARQTACNAIRSWCAAHRLHGRSQILAVFLCRHVEEFGSRNLLQASMVYRGPPGGRRLADYMMPKWPRFPGFKHL